MLSNTSATPEQAHHDGDESDTVDQLHAAECQPRLRRDAVEPDQSEHDTRACHQQRLWHRALGEEGEHHEAQHHQAEILGRAKRDRNARKPRRHQHQRDQRKRAGDEGTEGRDA
ncbi:hypothetical protein ACVWWR_003584 [Bradyrhizobium sp. LM3.2]